MSSSSCLIGFLENQLCAWLNRLRDRYRAPNRCVPGKVGGEAGVGNRTDQGKVGGETDIKNSGGFDRWCQDLFRSL